MLWIQRELAYKLESNIGLNYHGFKAEASFWKFCIKIQRRRLFPVNATPMISQLLCYNL